MMKKFGNAFKVLITVFVVFFIASCNDVIFYNIREEVKLEDSQINGEVKSIVRFNNKVYVQNGKIWQKDEGAPEHNWTKISHPKTSAKFNFVSKLVSDDNYLYAMIVIVDYDEEEGENIPQSCAIYCTSDLKEWKRISIGSSDTFLLGFYGPKIFCTNDKSNAKAYIRYYDILANKWQVSPLNGDTDPATTNLSIVEENLTTSPTISTLSCVNFGGTVYFSNSSTVISNKVLGKDYVFVASGSNVKYTDDISKDFSEWQSFSASDSVYSLGCANDFMLVGTSDGLYYSKIIDDNGTLKFDDLTTYANVQGTLSSYYEIHCILVEDPSKSAVNESTVYATTIFRGSPSNTSALPENCGLWSYYPERSNGRGKWNRE